MTADVQSTQSVLDLMTASIMANKTAAAAGKPSQPTLTPVGTERIRLDREFPFDVPQEQIEQSLAKIEYELAFLRKAFHIVATVPPERAEDEVKAKERAADEAAREREAIQTVEREETRDFDKELAEKQAAAQAAVFTRKDQVEGNDVGWVCPVHDLSEMRTSKRKRQYRACPKCDLFEMLA